MSAVTDAIAAGISANRRIRGQAITYTQGATILQIDDAVHAETLWSAEAVQPGVRVGEKSTDWLLEAAQLTDGTDLIKPLRGDTITTEDGTIYRVMPFGPDNQLWQWHDRAGQTTVRVYTKDRSSQ